MKNISANLQAILDGEVLTICWLWEIVRRDEVRLGFTNFDRDLTVGNLTFVANPGLTPSAIETDSRLNNATNLELTSVFSSNGITQSDLLAGKYDWAIVNLFLANYLNPNERVIITSGYLGEVRNSDLTFTVEFKGLEEKLSQKITEVTSKFCRYDLGDANCTKNLTAHTHNLTVWVPYDRHMFKIGGQRDNGQFAYGSIEFVDGNNAGFKTVCATFIDNTITLFEPAPYNLSEGDAFIAIDGCDKRRETCRDKFANAINFGGEPDLPGIDEYYRGF